MILGLRIGRRLLAAVTLDHEAFMFYEARYVASRTTTSDPGMTRYFTRLLEQFKPTAVYFYAPAGTGTTAEQLVAGLEQTAAHAGVPVKRLAKADLFTSATLVPARTRRELREQLSDLWPVLSEGKLHRQTVLAEAAASALVGELRQGLPPS